MRYIFAEDAKIHFLLLNDIKQTTNTTPSIPTHSTERFLLLTKYMCTHSRPQQHLGQCEGTFKERTPHTHTHTHFFFSFHFIQQFFLSNEARAIRQAPLMYYK